VRKVRKERAVRARSRREAVSRAECIAQRAMPMSTPSMSSVEVRMLPRVEPPGESLWLSEFLPGDAGEVADLLVACGGEGVGHVFAVGVYFDDGAATEARKVDGVHLFEVVGMGAVGTVGRDEE